MGLSADPYNKGVEEAINQLKKSVEEQILVLEDFYYEHDLDERAILFEKQRLKLRKLVNMKIEAVEPPPEMITAGDEYMPEDEMLQQSGRDSTRGRNFLRKGDGVTMSTIRKAPMEDKEEGPYVTSAGPYIEPQYFENWRYVKKDKWVTKNDFASGKEKKNFPEHLQLNDFLHNGPYIENAFKACLRSEDGGRWLGDNFKRHV